KQAAPAGQGGGLVVGVQAFVGGGRTADSVHRAHDSNLPLGGQDLGERTRQDLDVGVQRRLGGGDQQDVVQARIRVQAAVGHAAQNAVVGHRLHHISGVLRQLDRELVEEARG